jgi:hypothetical protein
MGTNRAYPNREPYFYSTCLVGRDLDAFEGQVEESDLVDTLETTVYSYRLTTACLTGEREDSDEW